MYPKIPFQLKAVAVASLLALSACATVDPVPLTSQDIKEQGVKDRLLAKQGIEPISGALTLDESIARALKYNLDRRVKMMEEALAMRQLDVTKLDMLPKILAQAGYSNRNNEYGTVGNSGVVSASQERIHTLSELGASWSLLDWGMSYYNSRQQADRFLIASEKRRKAMHLLMQDVRTAFWRVASAQNLQGQVLAATKMAEEALGDARKVEESRVRNPVDALRYQRQVLENLRLLEAIAQELSAAQVDLASLINAPMGQTLRVSEPAPDKSRAAIMAVPVERLEEVALANNADIREQNYNARIAREEARKTLVRMFPNLGFNYSMNYDTDKYLLNDNWNRAGIQLSFNLMNLFTYDTQNKLTEGGIALADQRRVTAHAAVIAQLHLARLQVANADTQLDRAEQIFTVDRRLADLIANRESAQQQSKLDRVSGEVAAILSQLRFYQAQSQLHAAQARLEATLGVEPVIGSVTELSLPELTRQLRQDADVGLAKKVAGESAQARPSTANPAVAATQAAKVEVKAAEAKAAPVTPAAAPNETAKPAQQAEAAPAPTAEAKVEPNPETKATPKAAEAKVEPKVEPKVEAKVEPKVEVKAAEAKAAPVTPAAAPNETAKPAQQAKAALAPAAQAQAPVAAAPAPSQPVAQAAAPAATAVVTTPPTPARSAIQPDSKPAPTAEAKVEPKPETKATPKAAEAKVEPKVEPKVEAKVEPKVEARAVTQPSPAQTAALAPAAPLQSAPLSPPAPDVATGKAVEQQSSPVQALASESPVDAVNAWAQAWQSNNADAFMSFYAKGFQPEDGQTRSVWESERRARLSKQRVLEVRLESVKLRSQKDDWATVSFIQYYKAETFQSRVGKVLFLVKSGGRWQIYKEQIGL